MYDIFHPDGTVFMNLRMIFQYLSGHDCHISGRRQMRIIIQSTAVDKMGILHAEFCCLLIHLLYKITFTATDMFRKSYRSIICTGNRHTFEQCFHSLGLIRLQIDLRSTHRCCIL